MIVPSIPVLIKVVFSGSDSDGELLRIATSLQPSVWPNSRAIRVPRSQSYTLIDLSMEATPASIVGELLVVSSQIRKDDIMTESPGSSSAARKECKRRPVIISYLSIVLSMVETIIVSCGFDNRVMESGVAFNEMTRKTEYATARTPASSLDTLSRTIIVRSEEHDSR